MTDPECRRCVRLAREIGHGATALARLAPVVGQTPESTMAVLLRMTDLVCTMRMHVADGHPEIIEIPAGGVGRPNLPAAS